MEQADMIAQWKETESIPVSLPPITGNKKNVNITPSFIHHFDNSIEMKILSLVEYGRTQELEEALAKLEYEEMELPDISDNIIRSFKNVFIISTALVSRAAVKGGMDYDTATVLADGYLIQIEKLNHYNDIHHFLMQMFRDFTRRTAKCRAIDYDSNIINKIRKFVQSHLYEKVTVQSISEYMNMNRSYLSRHFKQKTGMSIIDYINSAKINEAIRLLETTELSILSISTQLGYSVQNYFHTVFKKVTGKTPNYYRKVQTNNNLNN